MVLSWVITMAVLHSNGPDNLRQRLDYLPSGLKVNLGIVQGVSDTSPIPEVGENCSCSNLCPEGRYRKRCAAVSIVIVGMLESRPDVYLGRGAHWGSSCVGWGELSFSLHQAISW